MLQTLAVQVTARGADGAGAQGVRVLQAQQLPQGHRNCRVRGDFGSWGVTGTPGTENSTLRVRYSAIRSL